MNKAPIPSGTGALLLCSRGTTLVAPHWRGPSTDGQHHRAPDNGERPGPVYLQCFRRAAPEGFSTHLTRSAHTLPNSLRALLCLLVSIKAVALIAFCALSHNQDGCQALFTVNLLATADRWKEPHLCPIMEAKQLAAGLTIHVSDAYLARRNAQMPSDVSDGAADG